MNQRRWAPPAAVDATRQWAALPDLPALLPGEDRDFGAGLFVDLTPSSSWFTDASSCIRRRDWARVKRLVRGRAHQMCEVCRRPESRDTGRWLDVHERWHYQTPSVPGEPGSQTLRRLICLCTDCHTATHCGLGAIPGKDAHARIHLSTVRRESLTAIDQHIEDALDLWHERSDQAWTLDLSILTAAGIALATPADRVGGAGCRTQDGTQHASIPLVSTAGA